MQTDPKHGRAMGELEREDLREVNSESRRSEHYAYSAARRGRSPR
jgi:hypothetical protein